MAYDGKSSAKLLEFNADTPTSLFAAGQLAGDADQFNSLHEKLIARWRQIGADRFVPLACMQASVEDFGTTGYIEECARQAGLSTQALDMRDMGLSQKRGFVDRSGREIALLFKLYPWEWMFNERFGRAFALRDARIVEPAWKMLLSNKGMLALAWDMAPNHPNLLPCFFDDDPRASGLGTKYARKPLYSHEGGNVELHDGDERMVGPDLAYGGGHVRQALRCLPDFDGNFPVAGCWLVGDEAAGLGLREDRSPITSNHSRFVPHVILD